MRERAESRLEGSATLLDLTAELEKLKAEPDESVAGHRQITLFKGHNSTVAAFAFEAGGGMREHSAPGVVTVHVLRGQLDINVPGETIHVAANNVLVIPPGMRHDVRAVEATEMLLTISLSKH
jgi:quercetin dioxygenase-like cupin family protein